MKTRTRFRCATAVALGATAGGMLVAIPTPASAAGTCASPTYKRQYFANTTLTGTPKKTNCDAAVNESWGAGGPTSGLPANGFSVRWTVTRDFGSGGPFTFTGQAQDGLRVYVDGVRKIDLWKNVSATLGESLDVTIPTGKHTLRVDYANWTGPANVKFSYTPRTSASVDKTKPLAPTVVSATYSATARKTVLTWGRNQEMDLAGYRVYRRPSGSAVWTQVATTSATATGYTNSPPATGQTFLYEVRAYDKAGNVSTGSVDRSVTTVDKTPPARVTATVAMGPDRDRESFVISWKPVADAVRYRVLSQQHGSADWTEVATTTGTSVTDYRSGHSPWYRVEAYDAAGNVAPASSTDEVNGQASWGARATDVTAAYAGDNQALLQWSLPLDTFALSWSDFRLLRGVGTPTREETTPVQYCTSLSHVQEGDYFRFTCRADVTLGTTNYLAVEPYLSVGERSLPSDAVAVDVPAGPAPATALTGVANGDRYDFTWTPSTSADVDHYELRSGLWHEATADRDAWFQEYMGVDVPADVTSFRWPYLGNATEDFVLVAVAADGTQLSAEESPRVHMQPSVSTSTE
ncbi:fibronectin type III domain-containing protein [Streptomyces fuscichromogenes]|uniref:fibronectin type III domain-containing protein n=1 Tax=Streptomyces fuscichromogenes TaxID=1324013 RepID=UPI00381923C3